MLNRDPEYLGKLQDYYAEHRVLPSFTSVAKLVGLKSTSAVAAMVGRMKDAGFLDQAPDRRLQPGKRFFERDIADSVRAGLPQPANDVPGQAISVDEYLIKSPSRTVLLAVKGDSMINAGLMSGDMVIVERSAPTKPGDIVVAIVDNEYTVKYLEFDKKGFYLLPGNKEYPSIRPKDSLEIYGRVVGCYRKYG
ncbi:MAG: LexA family transcriptional regulator [Sideroxydans sp.]|nr:LexA family transcriptional regulator [Sideroxydans sp.]